MVGVVTGLAWTEVGGEILTIESVLLPGKGTIKHTGKLGDVMQESVSAALSYVRSRSAKFGIKPTVFEKRDIHVHVPEGATPKDGPSAGVAMATSIVSVLTGIPVRRDVAMTGEITLRGRILPIGGLKEKLLAALRAGITTVFIPKENEKDLAEIPDSVKKALTLIPVAEVDEVIAQALARRPGRDRVGGAARAGDAAARAAGRRLAPPLTRFLPLLPSREEAGRRLPRAAPLTRPSWSAKADHLRLPTFVASKPVSMRHDRACTTLAKAWMVGLRRP